MALRQICKQCGMLKANYLFGWDYSMSNGLRATCRACRRREAASTARKGIPVWITATADVTLEALLQDAEEYARRNPRDFMIRAYVQELTTRPQASWSDGACDVLYAVWNWRQLARLDAASVDGVDDIEQRLPINKANTERMRGKRFAFGEIEL